MVVHIRLFAALRERAGRDRLELELPEGALVADALAAVDHLAGGLSLVLAVNREYAPRDQALQAGDELALIPPVSGGAPEIAASCREVFVVLRQGHRAFVPRVDFRTSVGYGDGPGSRERLGLTGRGPVLVITDLGVLAPDPLTCALTLTHLHPGVTVEQARAATGWELAVSPSLQRTAPPSTGELRELRALLGSGSP